MGPKMPFSTQKHKKGEQGGGELPPQGQNHGKPSYPSTHPHYPLSNTFLLICSAFLPATWFSHTMLPKTQHLPSPARETDKKQKRGEEVFSLPKRVKPQICLDLLVRRRKRDTSSWFWKETWVWNQNKYKIRKFFLERTKKWLKKKEQHQKQTVFVWTDFFLTMTWTLYILTFSSLTTIQ